MNAYEFLGLEFGTTDEGAIRKAYAAALKAHRPDVDPSGFARVRSAYQWVMARRAAVAESAEDDEGEDDGPRDERAGDDASGSASARDEDERTIDEADTAPGRPDEVRGGTGSPETVPIPEPARARSPVSDELDDLEDRIRAILEDPDFDPTRALAVARRLLATPVALCEARFSRPGVALAVRVALDDPALAERIGAAIYEVASARERAALPFDEIDRRRRFGALCAGSAAATSRVVRAILEGRDPAEIGDSNDRTAFERDMGSRVDGDPLLEWVLMSARALPYTQRRLSRRASRATTSHTAEKSRHAPAKTPSGGAGVIAILMLALAGGVRACNRPPAPHRSPISDSFDDLLRSRPHQFPLPPRSSDELPRPFVPGGVGADPDAIRAAYDRYNAEQVRVGNPAVPYPPGIGPSTKRDSPPPK